MALGASRLHAFFSITLPHVAPGLSWAPMIVFTNFRHRVHRPKLVGAGAVAHRHGRDLPRDGPARSDAGASRPIIARRNRRRLSCSVAISSPNGTFEDLCCDTCDWYPQKITGCDHPDQELRVSNRRGRCDVRMLSEGSSAVLVGPSGSGKTTIPSAVLAGLEIPSIWPHLASWRIDGIWAPAHERGIGLHLSTPVKTFRRFNVFENIAWGLKLRRLGRAEATTQVWPRCWISCI